MQDGEENGITMALLGDSKKAPAHADMPRPSSGSWLENNYPGNQSSTNPGRREWIQGSPANSLEHGLHQVWDSGNLRQRSDSTPAGSGDGCEGNASSSMEDDSDGKEVRRTKLSSGDGGKKKRIATAKKPGKHILSRTMHLWKTAVVENRSSSTLHLQKRGMAANFPHSPPQVVLDKLQEKSTAGRLEGEEKQLAKLIRWKLEQIALRCRHEEPLKRWLLIQQLVRQQSEAGHPREEATDQLDASMTQAGDLHISLQKPDCLFGIFALVDEDCTDSVPLINKLRPLSKQQLVELYHPVTSLNLLQHALANHRLNSARTLVALGGQELVVASNFVVVADEAADSVVETCLHRVVSLGNLTLARAILDAFHGEARKSYLTAETAITLDKGSIVGKSYRGGSEEEGSENERVKASVLHLAALQGHAELVHHFIVAESMPVELASNSHATPICFAAAHGHLPVVELLRVAGASLDCVDITQRTFLHYSILSENEGMVKYALKYANNTVRSSYWAAENPLVMAAWRSSIKIVQALLEDATLLALIDTPTPHRGNTALHVACSRHDSEGAEITRLLLKSGADVEKRSRNGKTPLMCAAYAGNTDSLVALSERMTSPKARYFSAVRENGKSVWDYAIGSSQTKVLIALLEIARFCSDTDANGSHLLRDFIRMPAEHGGVTPLHAAAAKGDTEKLRVMLTYPLPLDKVVDVRGDTFLHTAAREGQLKVLSSFAKRASCVNQQNMNGDSVMMVACAMGHHGCIAALVPFADLSLVNKRSRTAVHELCCLADAPYALLRDVVRRAADVSWDLLARPDDSGRTALHLLAIHPNLVERERFFKLFYQSFSPHPLCNAARCGGSTPLHDALTARRTNNVCALLKTFGASLSVNAKDDRGRTPLHIAVRELLVDAVLPLIQSGGDLLMHDNNGNTTLHLLISCVGERPQLIKGYLKVLYELIDCTVLWYCKFKGIVPVPKKGADEHKYKQYLKMAVTLLITSTYNDKQMNVLMWSMVKCCSCKEMLAALLTIPDVFCLERVGSEPPAPNEQCVYYDVTDFVPNTLVPLRQAALLDSGITPYDARASMSPYAGHCEMQMMSQAYSNMASDAERQTRFSAKPALIKILQPKYTDGPQKTATRNRNERSTSKQSLVELIVQDRREQRWQLLDVTPIREITMDYWEPYKYIYALFMAMHLAYMALFSHFSLQITSPQYVVCTSAVPANATSALIVPHQTPDIYPYAFLLIWPCLLITVDLVYCVFFFRRKCKSCRAPNSIVALFAVPIRQLEFFYVECYWLFGVVFSWLTLAWFVLYALGDCHQDYVLAIVMISGWMYTVNFTQGIRGVHHFSLVLQRIVLKDFFKFSFVFASLMIGYSFAFQVMSRSIPSLHSTYPEVGYTFFTAFNWLIGMGEFYEISREEFNQQGKEESFLMAMFVSYVLILNIVLVNLLIAIMNDSYTSIYQRHQLMWRINSLKHALDIENHFPFVGNLLRKLRNNEIIKDSFSQHTRFYIKVSREEAFDPTQKEDDSSQAAMMARLDAVCATNDRLENTLDELSNKVDHLSNLGRRQTSRTDSSPVPALPTSETAANKFIEDMRKKIMAELKRKVRTLSH